MGKDLDRDLAEKLEAFLKQCLTLVEQINDNKFVPHITQQPSNVIASVGDTIQFTVKANNVKSYQWQYRHADWEKFTDTKIMQGYNTDTLTVNFTSGRNGWVFRVAITGLDGSIIYSDGATLSTE